LVLKVLPTATMFIISIAVFLVVHSAYVFVRKHAKGQSLWQMRYHICYVHTVGKLGCLTLIKRYGGGMIDSHSPMVQGTQATSLENTKAWFNLHPVSSFTALYELRMVACSWHYNHVVLLTDMLAV